MKNNNQSESASRRQQAEKLLDTKSTKSISELSETEILKLYHELQVHQIELELQNKELMLAKEQIEIVSKKYIELYDFSPSGYFTLSVNGEILQLNLIGAKMLGKDRSSLKSRLFQLFIPESSRLVFNEFLKKVYRTNIEKCCELNLSMTADSPVYVQLTAIVKENGGNCFVTAHDITNQKLAELNIHKLNRIYALLISINQTIVHIHDRQLLFEKACQIAVDHGGFVMAWIGMVNTATNKVEVVASSGRSVEYLNDINIDLNDALLSSGPTGQAVKTGKSVYSNDIESDDKMIPWRKNALKSGFQSSITLPVIISGRTIGAYTMYSAEKDFFNEDEIKLLDELVSDLSFAIEFIENESERSRIEYELWKSRALLQFIIDGTTDPIFVKDRDGKYLLFNHASELVTGKMAKDVLGKDDAFLFPANIAADLMISDQKVMNDGIIKTYEEYVTTFDGKKITFLSTKGPILDSNDKSVGVFGVSRDITERKKYEKEINLKNEELQKLNASKDKFFSIIAHDLRSPFNGFLGLTQMMAEDLPSLTMSEIQDLAVSMSHSANNLYRLIENLLDWSQVQRGSIAFNPVVFKLKPTINESIAILIESAKKKNIEVSLDIYDDPEVFADLNMLQSIIRNLVSNALKFTPKGGKVSISAQMGSNRNVVFSVHDTGIGMKSEMVENLFRIDYNSSRRGTEGEPSTGLGLILCKEFVEKQKGKIWVTSEIGNGSTFSFTLPASDC